MATRRGPVIEATGSKVGDFLEQGTDAIGSVSKKVKGVVYGAANVVLPWAHAFQIYDVNDDSFSNISRLNPAFARKLNEAIVKKADANLSDSPLAASTLRRVFATETCCASTPAKSGVAALQAHSRHACVFHPLSAF